MAFRQIVVNNPQQPHVACAPAIARLELATGVQEHHVVGVRDARCREPQSAAGVPPGIRRVPEGQLGAHSARVLAQLQRVQRTEVHHQRAPCGCRHRLGVHPVAGCVPRSFRRIQVGGVGQRHRRAAAKRPGQGQHHFRSCLGLGGRRGHRRDRDGDRRAAVTDRQREVLRRGRGLRPHRLAQGQRHPRAGVVRRGDCGRRHVWGGRRRGLPRQAGLRGRGRCASGPARGRRPRLAARARIRSGWALAARRAGHAGPVQALRVRRAVHARPVHQDPHRPAAAGLARTAHQARCAVRARPGARRPLRPRWAGVASRSRRVRHLVLRARPARTVLKYLQWAATGLQHRHRVSLNRAHAPCIGRTHDQRMDARHRVLGR